jgi:hypothetical protein
MASTSIHTEEAKPKYAGADTLMRARLYQSWGFVPIAIKPGEKAPVSTGWPLTQQCYAIDRIKSALTYYEWKQELNVGILCGQPSKIVVLDIDVKNGGLERYEHSLEGHEVPHTFTVRTGGGGLHLYFKYEGTAAMMRTSHGTLGPGWDIRSNGGQIIGPYSIHPVTGSKYLPISGFDAWQDGTIRPIIGTMPEWIVAQYHPGTRY